MLGDDVFEYAERTQDPALAHPGSIHDCFWHGREPIPEGAYLVCAECGHCWPTEADLLADMQRVMMETHVGVTAPMSGEDVFFCPLCAHDF